MGEFRLTPGLQVVADAGAMLVSRETRARLSHGLLSVGHWVALHWEHLGQWQTHSRGRTAFSVDFPATKDCNQTIRVDPTITVGHDQTAVSIRLQNVYSLNN